MGVSRPRAEEGSRPQAEVARPHPAEEGCRHPVGEACPPHRVVVCPPHPAEGCRQRPEAVFQLPAAEASQRPAGVGSPHLRVAVSTPARVPTRTGVTRHRCTCSFPSFDSAALGTLRTSWPEHTTSISDCWRPPLASLRVASVGRLTRRSVAPPIARGPAESLLVRWPGAFSVANCTSGFGLCLGSAKLS